MWQALSKCKMLGVPTLSIQILSVLQNQISIQAHHPDHFTQAQSVSANSQSTQFSISVDYITPHRFILPSQLD